LLLVPALPDTQIIIVALIGVLQSGVINLMLLSVFTIMWIAFTTLFSTLRCACAPAVRLCSRPVVCVALCDWVLLHARSCFALIDVA
jgi:hypothetical protein